MENIVDMLGGKLLSYGVSGFALLMIGFTYYLMKSELKRDLPRPIAIKTIWMFMGLVILSTIVVGVFSLPLAQKNNELNEEVNSSAVDLSKLMVRLAQYEYALNDLLIKLDNAKDPNPKNPTIPPKFDGTLMLDTLLIAKYVDFSKVTLPKEYTKEDINKSTRIKLKQEVNNKLNRNQFNQTIQQ